ncbi:MAG: NAD-dependent epimerase/dehydratase family protein [bacterium]|nr:NAD-dependent epimerase/dehydratase family protein [bacterium]
MSEILYKKILVTGSTCTIGGALQEIQSEYPERTFLFVSSKDCNLARLDEVSSCLKRTSPDAILHFAAVSGGIELSMNHPATLLRDNVLMNMNVMEAARMLCIKKTVMTLSTGMYPSDAPNPLKEEYMHNGYPHPSTYSYAFAKRLVDPMIKAYRKEYGMNVIGLIPNAIVGGRSNFSYSAATMVPALIRRFYENREGSEKLLVWGDGSPLREITYGDDIVRAFMWCLDNYNEEQVLNIGSTEEMSVKEVAYIIADIFKIDRSRIVFDATKPSGVLRKSTDNNKFIKLSNFSYTSIRETLQKTIDYFCAHYPDPKKLRL